MVARDLNHVVLIFKSCMNKGWSCSCKETWDNGACIILRTQSKHTRSNINVMLVSVHNHMQALKRGSERYCLHMCTRQRRCFSSISNCAINKELVKLLTAQYGDWKMRLWAPVCFNTPLFHIKVQTKSLDVGQEVTSLHPGARQSRWYTAILWEKQAD